jgi:hypothetical protein
VTCWLVSGLGAMMDTRPAELTRENFVGQSLKVELYEKKLEAVVGGRSRKTRRRLHLSWKRIVQGAVAATTLHRWRRSLSERRLLVRASFLCTASVCNGIRMTTTVCGDVVMCMAVCCSR